MSRAFQVFTQFFDGSGQPLKDGTLEFFVNRVYSTQQTTFSDASLNDDNPNPVTLDGEGRLPFDIWLDGVYSVELRSRSNVQIDLKEDVGGDVGSRTAFSDWSQTIIYNIPAFVVASNGLYYRGLSNENLGNDPTLDAGTNKFWEEFKLRGIWNNSVIYSTGIICQSTVGNLWKSIVDDNEANDPETDNGTNWVPAIDGAKIPEITALEALISWDIPETADFIAVASESRQIDASLNIIDVELPVLVIGDSFIYHNLITSTFKVQILNPIETIKGIGGDIAAGINMELEPGQSVQMIAKSTTILSIVGALV